MTEEQYSRISKPFRDNAGLLQALKISNLACTLVGFITYPSLLIYLLVKKDFNVFYYLLIPAFSFIMLTIIRKKINSKRPYELLEIEPLIKKEKEGSSFPSRHVFSIFLIAGCAFGVNILLGIVVVICGLLLAVIRVVGGIHFPKDVAVGAIIGLACGIISTLCFVLIR